MLSRVEIENLPANELEILLEFGQDLLSPSELLGVQLFIQRIGGMQNARAAIEMLKQLEQCD
ncbi:hypothetical protein [Blastopirellula marina]|uniref:Uncharacterized protein n=1 Tax=Blastopirellula marina TaxID=124 RepID=A0A2S8GVY1_9BACT|nr:hypothetical protein [Blastopirellula marina]PQO48204.1 hypothetical protein C5Y93_00535 [Blastopirellula marina]